MWPTDVPPEVWVEGAVFAVLTIAAAWLLI